MCRVVVSVLALAVAAGAQVDTLWVRHHQHAVSFPNQYINSRNSAAADAAGNVYICAYGQYSSPNNDLIVVKYTAAGELAWSDGLDLGGSEYGYGIAVGSDGAVYVTGTTVLNTGSSDLVVAKWNADGVRAWQRRLQGDSVGGANSGVAVVVSGNSVFVGGYVCNQNTGRDLAVARLDATTGLPLWLRSVSRSNSPENLESVYELAAAGNSVYVCGQTHGGTSGLDATVARIDTAGNLVWRRDYPASGTASEGLRALAIGSNRLVAVGYTTASGSNDALVLSYTLNGDLEWARTFNGPGAGFDHANDVAMDGAGNAFVTGIGSGSTGSDLMTLKYSPSGSRLWARLHDGGSADAGYWAALDGAGNVLVGGFTSGGSSSYQLTVIKYGTSGEQGWVYGFRPLGSAGTNCATMVSSLGSDVLVAGYAHWGYPNYTDPVAMRLREVPDVGVMEIMAPTGTVAPGAALVPRARVRNYSLRPASCGCRMKIAESYVAETTLALAAGETLVVSFPQWTAGAYGSWRVSCSTMATLDYDRGNDRAVGLVYVSGPNPDVAAEAIAVPAGNVPYQSTLMPAARWRNRGSSAVSCSVFCRIERGGATVYRQAIYLAGLAADGGDTLVRFPCWLASAIGYYTLKCSTSLGGDANTANDTVSLVFGVVNQPIGEWVQIADVPAGTGARPVSKGGAVGSDGLRVYVLKGNKTFDVCCYDPVALSWSVLPQLPGGAYGRPVSKGGAIVPDGNGRVYVVKGNRSLEFYRYDPALGWSDLTPIPPGPRNRAPNGGTGIVYGIAADTGFVYLLKGTGTAEFFRYNTVTDSWQQLPDAPAGLSGKLKYRDGSALAIQGDSLIYCLKGGENEVFRFDIRSNLWLEGQTVVPFVGAGGRRKKVKSGGGMTIGSGTLAVVKGGNTTEFWRLEAADSSWREYPEVPTGISNRRVKDGGGVVWADGAYYVLKGCKTSEMWCFRLFSGDGQMTAGVGGFVPSAKHLVWPNPVRAGGVVQFQTGSRGRATVSIVDVSGRRRGSWDLPVDAQGRAALALTGLESGVYYLKLANGNSETTVRILVCR